MERTITDRYERDLQRHHETRAASLWPRRPGGTRGLLRLLRRRGGDDEPPAGV